MKHLILRSLATAACLLAASSSYASLVLVSPEVFQGTGLGTVNTILTIQNTGTETGAVGFDGTDDVFTGNVKTGNSQTQTRSIDELHIASASDLRIVFNAVEPDGNSINLTNLQLNIYSPTGTLLFNSGAFTSHLFPETFTGTGNSGFVYTLDAEQAAAAQAAAFTDSFGANRIGLSATASLAAGGNETFYVAASSSDVLTPPASVPEPGTVALLGLGLLGFTASRCKSSNTKSA